MRLSVTNHRHLRSSCPHSPRGWLRYADRLRRPRWRYRHLSINIPPGPLNTGRTIGCEEHIITKQIRYPDDSTLNEPIRLSVAAPAYNEGAGIAAVVGDWLTFLRGSPEIKEFEIVICNDGSNDSTGAVLAAMASDNPEIHIVQFAQNQGAAVALTAAIKATHLDWVLLIDSDGQFPIENLHPLLLGARGAPALAAIGRRRKKDAWFGRFGTWASGFACNLLYGTHIGDFNSACKLVWGPLLRAFHLEAKGMNYSTEVTARLLESNASIVEVAIDHRPRTSGTSSMRVIRGSIHRFLFVCYLAMRRFLFRVGVLQLPKFD